MAVFLAVCVYLVAMNFCWFVPEISTIFLVAVQFKIEKIILMMK